MRLSDKTLEYYKYLEELSTKINSSNEDKILKDIYLFLEEVSSDYYRDGKMDKLFGYLLDEAIDAEKKVKSYITDVSIKNNDNNIVSNIVALGRRNLEVMHSMDINHLVNIDNVDLSGECEEASKIIKDICDGLNITNFMIDIEPGYDRRLRLFHGDGYHFFNILLIDHDYYLVDLTYKQFFMKRQSLLERLNVPCCCGILAGRFMVIDEERNRVSDELLKNGYLKLNENNLKSYLDGFTMSYRNGLYYQDHDYDGYSIDQYIEFLCEEKSMADYEDMEGLGYLKRPIKKGK